MNRIQPSLLLVEDTIDDEELSLKAIKASGVPCDVKVIRHGAEAMALLHSLEGNAPDLIVLDFHLPGYNGLEILREVRRNERTRHLPVVMLSALGSDDEIMACLAGGANSCVQKAMDPFVYAQRVGQIVHYWLTVDKRPWLGMRGQGSQ